MAHSRSPITLKTSEVGNPASFPDGDTWRACLRTPDIDQAKNLVYRYIILDKDGPMQVGGGPGWVTNPEFAHKSLRKAAIVRVFGHKLHLGGFI